MIGSADVEAVGTRGGRRLADVEVALHPLETKRYLVLALKFRDGGTDVVVLTGIDKVVVVGGATDTSANIIKENEGQLFEDDLRAQFVR